jgi:GH15 family glucan-1,4-alpha-glucosidase
MAPRNGGRAVRRRYRGDSLVLEQEFETPTGLARVVDCMPIRERRPDVIRLVEGVHGRVDMQMELAVRFDYGSILTRTRQGDDDTCEVVGGPDALSLRSPVSLTEANSIVTADFVVEAGQRLPFVLSWHRSHEPAEAPIDPLPALDETVEWWQAWADQCTFEGAQRDAVVRSLLTLKALTFAPSGGIVAAATTSLPEWPGGARNWDYRYCWLRDSTFTLYALMAGGYTAEADSWRRWLVRAVAGEPSDIQIMYGCAGERRFPELELPWLPGYCESQPVRTGNAAMTQRQLDVFGEVMDSLHLARQAGLSMDRDVWSIQREMLDYLDGAWQEPDRGIWEVRGPERHFTHSKMMAWVAFDRAIRDATEWDLDGPVERWRTCRAAIHEQVCELGFNRGRQAFTQFYGSSRLDASLLMMPLVGFLPPDDARVIGTVDAIARDLDHGGFVRRYLADQQGTAVDGLPPGEGVFSACTCWLADNLILQGRVDEARELFERVLDCRNDLGLLSEQYDPERKRQLGNFPQAFSHVGIINTASNLARAHGPADARRGDDHTSSERSRNVRTPARMQTRTASRDRHD